jgi:H+/gluconate symporter-like permease
MQSVRRLTAVQQRADIAMVIAGWVLAYGVMVFSPK